MKTFLAWYLFEFGPWYLKFSAQKNTAPKNTGAKTMWIGSLGSSMFWGTCATNFSIFMTKMEGVGQKILGTTAKFKWVPCQKSYVNLA